MELQLSGHEKNTLMGRLKENLRPRIFNAQLKILPYWNVNPFLVFSDIQQNLLYSSMSEIFVKIEKVFI